jgi:hypothetical protein
MSNRPDGKTKFSSRKVRPFKSNVVYSNQFYLYEIIKLYLSSKLNKRILITPILSKADIFDSSIDGFVSCIKISGYISDDTVNDNDVFEELYLFFENIFIKLELKELSFTYKNLDGPSHQTLIYKTKINKTSKSL